MANAIALAYPARAVFALGLVNISRLNAFVSGTTFTMFFSSNMG